MAFSNDGLQSLGSVTAGLIELWAYRTPDRLNAVTKSGYFGPASDRLHVGDFIFVNANVDDGVQADLRAVTHVQPDYVTTERV